MVESYLPTWAAALLPGLVLVITAMAVFLADSIDDHDAYHSTVAGIAILGTLTSLGVAVWYLVAGSGDPGFSILADQLVVDTTSLYFTLIVTAVTAITLVAGYDYLESAPQRGAFYSLLLLSATGMITLSAANSLVTAFVALELVSLPSYVLVAYYKNVRAGLEAGVKYFVIGAVSSAILLYGMSLLYAVTGHLRFDLISAELAGVDQVGVLGLGVFMIIAGVAFKIAAVPFHFWAPDAYHGAPAPVSAFLSSASKAAGFVFAFRLFIEGLDLGIMQAFQVDWVAVFGVLAVLTMVIANFAAVVQTNVKRMLAYSSVAHVGYTLIALAALSGVAVTAQENELVIAAGMAHLFVYAFMTTGAFLFIALGEYWDVGSTYDDYAGLASRAPLSSLAVTILVLSLAGLPVGGGFWSKYVLFTGAIDTGFWWLALVGVLTSVVSLYYYARLIKALWIDEPTQSFELSGRPNGIYVGIAVTTVLTVALLAGFDVIIDPALEAATLLLS